MRGTLTRLLPVGTENRKRNREPRCSELPGWHKEPGIRREPTPFELTGEGVQKCLVWDHGDHLELKRILVRPEFQGKGVGSAILRELKRRGKKIVLFPVSDDGRQVELERFYTRAGFVPDFFDPETFVWEP